VLRSRRDRGSGAPPKHRSPVMFRRTALPEGNRARHPRQEVRPDRLSQACGNRGERLRRDGELVDLDSGKSVNSATPVPRFQCKRQLLQMSSHIEQTVAGERYCLVLSEFPVLRRLLTVTRNAFRVGFDAAAGAPSPLYIKAVKWVHRAWPCGYRRGPGLRGIGPSLMT
jgi:hypothetical protein